MKENVVSLRVNLAEAKANLSKYLRRVKAGETVVICERNVPIAELRPIGGEHQRRERPLRPVHPGWEIAESFFDPLPNDLLDAFEGK